MSAQACHAGRACIVARRVLVTVKDGRNGLVIKATGANCPTCNCTRPDADKLACTAHPSLCDEHSLLGTASMKPVAWRGRSPALLVIRFILASGMESAGAEGSPSAVALKMTTPFSAAPALAAAAGRARDAASCKVLHRYGTCVWRMIHRSELIFLLTGKVKRDVAVQRDAPVLTHLAWRWVRWLVRVTLKQPLRQPIAAGCSPLPHRYLEYARQLRKARH